MSILEIALTSFLTLIVVSFILAFIEAIDFQNKREKDREEIRKWQSKELEAADTGK